MERTKLWFWAGVCAVILLGMPMNTRGAATFATGSCAFGEKKLKSLILENEFYRIVIVPDRGGRIVEWIDKKQGNVNVVNLPTDSAEPNYGGLLDDHGWLSSGAGFGDYYNFSYVYDLKATGPDEVVLEMWPFEQKLYTRTITLRSGNPMVKIVYTLNNLFQSDGANSLIRNVIWPSGNPAPDDHLYSTPLKKGVLTNSRYVNTAQGAKTDTVTAPWRAFGSVSQKRLVAFAFGDDLFEGAYDWEGSKTRPTFEWYFRSVPMGKTTRTEMWACLAHGFHKAVHVSDRMIADIEPARKGENVEIAWTFSSMDPDMKNAIIKTRITGLDGALIAEMKDISLADLAVDTPKQGSLAWKSNAAKPVVIEQSVYSAGKAIARYEIPFELGKADYERKPDFPKKAVFSDIPGWKYLPALELKTSERDRKTGYMVYSAEGKGKGTGLKNLRIDMGIDEYESYELRFMALGDTTGLVSVTAQLPSGMNRNNFTVSTTEKRTVKVWGNEKAGWKLLGTSSFTPEKEKDERIWLIINTLGMKPGTYTVKLAFRPETGTATTIPLTIKAWPVRLPEDRHFFLEPNSHLNQLGLLGTTIRGIKRWEWNLKGTEVYADDLYAHGTRMLKAYAYGTAPGASLVSIKLRSDGRFLTDALQQDSSILNRDPLPALDLSFWDPWLQLWLDRGFTRYSTVLGDLGPSYFSSADAFAKKYNAADPQKIRRWLSAETARYLKEKGYRYVYGTISDEIAADLFPAWKKVALDARECGWSPGVTISSGFFRNPELYRNAAPVMDYWIIGNPEAALIDRAKKDGYITDADSVGTYDGWGTWFREYGHMRASMWKYALNDVDVFWVQCYIRGPVESVVFNENNIPYGSGSWEGMRDGCEDANYLKGAMGMIAALKSTRGESGSRKFSERLEKIVKSLDKDEPSTIRNAKTDLLQLMLDLRKVLTGTRPSLMWRDLAVIEKGRPKFSIAAAAGGKRAAEHFSDEIAEKTGIRMRVFPDTGRADTNMIVFGHPNESLLLKTMTAGGIDLGATASYPAPGSYMIKEAGFHGKKIIAVIGTGEGLAKGAENFARFLTINVEYPGQYFVEK